MAARDSNLYCDVAVIGAGAAGLAAAIFTARRAAHRSIVVLDSARKLGAKILVSGGGRCNVTNRIVTPADFRGASPSLIRRVLNAFSVEQTVDFFREVGVGLHEEEHGKLFPDSNAASQVLTALLVEAGRLGIDIRPDHRVIQISRATQGFELQTTRAPLQAASVVLATGGMSLPKTGSDGSGYGLAEALGHTLVPPTPALVPLVLAGDMHRGLSGISHPAELTVRIADHKPVRLSGSLLWTHFGVSGPVVLDASGLWVRARAQGRDATIRASFFPGDHFASVESRLLGIAGEHPRRHLHNALSDPQLAGESASPLPGQMARALLQALRIAEDTPLAHLSRDDRRRLLRGLLEFPLPILDSRGYNYAEVTAGGVRLTEIDGATMESRCCPGLFLVGEILDVDGRIGGFNFQWAWSSGFVAGQALSSR